MKKITKLIGNTPLYKATNIMNKYNLSSKLYLKLEKDNFSGSSKDRLVYFIIKDAIDKKIINKNTTLIEATSGNTGISLSKICNELNLKCIIVMPDTVSTERIKMIEEFNSKVILTKGLYGMNGSIKKQKELLKEISNSFCLDQFNNEIGIKAHYETTAKEIYKELDGNIDIFISPVGTGTTFTGCSKYLKEQNKDIMCVAVEPLESNILNGGKIGLHDIEGIGAGFIPKTLDITLIDKVIDVKSSDAYFYTKELYIIEGLCCGISSGAALLAGIILAKEYQNKNIVCILPDDGNRYYSKGVFNN